MLHKKEKKLSECCRYFCLPSWEDADVPILVLRQEKKMSSKKTTAGAGGMAVKPMTMKDAARIHSAEAKANGGSVPKGSFTARAERAAALKGGK